MLNGFKIRNYWILTFFIIFCSFSAIYAQEIPDNYLGIDVMRMTEAYKSRGYSDETIKIEIEKIRERETKRFLEAREQESSLQSTSLSATKKSSFVLSNKMAVIESNMTARVSSNLLNAVVEENLIIKKGINTKFFIEPSTPDMTYKWIFYELDNVTKKDSASTPIAYQKYILPGIYKIEVEVTEANGCISYFTKNVEVVETGYCVRKPIDFAFETTSTNLNYTWTATNGAGVLVNEVVNKTGLYTFTPTLPGNYAIKLIATGTGKCETLFEESVAVISCDPPGEPCKNHIAIVVDESGSVDETEAKRIRAQLKTFIYEQAKVNAEAKGLMYISLIGMADSDDGTREDNILELKVSYGDLALNGRVYNWIENYGRRFGKPGISEGSDYWKSGLNVVLNSSFTLKPKLVLVITDGCQTADPAGLKVAMQKFDNYQNSPDKSEDKPHLYIIGINNGFYVDNSISSAPMARNQDPNFVPSLLKTSFDSTNSAFLGKSLQYLFNFDEGNTNAFPLERINGFDSASYFGHQDFAMLIDEPYYFSDNIIDAGVGCGDLSIKDFCSNCLSFQPEVGKEYVLSAWVKEETNIQVKSYENSQIDVVFYHDAEAADPDPNDPAAPSQIISTVELKPTGDIIDGWQRISGRFIIPENTITAGVVLNNKNAGIPIYFDDLRIHPIDGSVKAFVYDSETFKLMSELDENNYSTFYEYDNEGGLVRVKKETAKGVKTIQETRSGNVINPK